jgi:hypothetical protein
MRRERLLLVAGSCAIPLFVLGCGARSELDLLGIALPVTDAAADSIPPPPDASLDSAADVSFQDAGPSEEDSANLPVDPPRLLAPLSTSIVTSQTPTLRWVLPGDADGAHVEICRDRACTSVLTSFDATGASGQPAMRLPPGVLFWHAFGRSGRVTGAVHSRTWQFTVGHRTAGVDTSWGSVPDFNGDGRVDLLVGESEVGMQMPGRGPGFGYVFSGTSAGLSSSPSVKLQGPSGNSEFGISVGSGDFDGDGFADALVGAPGIDAYTGSAFVYPGGDGGLSSTPSATLTYPTSRGAQFGNSVAGVGDVNGDGYADAVVGANDYGYGSGQAGRAYVYLGSPTGLATTPNVVLTGPESVVEQFGSAVASAGDVNGDGYGDVVVAGAGQTPLDGGGGFVLARLYVYLGSASGISASPSANFPGPSANTGPGFTTLGGACDVNGDGYADIVAGGMGATAVYPGSPGGVQTFAAVNLVAPGVDNYAYEFKVAGAVRDLDGDGYDDVVTSYDQVFVYLGAAGGPSPAPSLTLTTPNGSPGIYGFEPAGVGDINGDGFADLGVGSASDGNFTGRVYLYPGQVGGVASTPLTSLAGMDGQGSEFGSCME